jgi:phosphoribosylformimino-5-aminoimidazole carboxamide ribotide isomerase
MMALRWQQIGARYLHVVDLDAAFEGVSQNIEIIQAICANLSIPVQLGGGIRSEAIARKWFDSGVARLIVGTLALEEPQRFAAMCAAFPGRIGVSLDSRGEKLKTRGWTADSGQTAADVLPRLAEAGACVIIHTDIERDGTHSGVNLAALEHLAKTSAVPVIASGGVSNMADIEALHQISRRANLEGVIVGRAIYENTLDLAQAIQWIDGQK